MSVWETREAGVEKRQELDAELRFRSLARRNKLIGLWAAEKLGMGEAAAADYARRIVENRVGEDNDEALARDLELQFLELDPPISPHRLRRKIAETNALAAREIFEGR